MSSLWKSIDPVDSIIFPGARMKSTYDEDGARSRGTPTRPLVRRLRSVTKVAKGYDLVRRLSSHTPPIPFPPRPPPRRRHTVRGRARHRGRRVQDAPALAPVPRPRRVVLAPGPRDRAVPRRPTTRRDASGGAVQRPRRHRVRARERRGYRRGRGGSEGDVASLTMPRHRPGVSRIRRREGEAVRGAFYTLVPIRPRSRGERRSLRTFPGASLRPPLAFNPRLRRLSTPTDAFELHPDIALYGTTLRTPWTWRCTPPCDWRPK